MSKEELIQCLNADLAAEWGTIIRYVYQIGKVFSFLTPEVRHTFEQKILDELNHAIALTDMIIDLGGEPAMILPPGPTPTGVADLLEVNLECELEDVEVYRMHAALAADLGMADVQTRLEGIAATRVGHSQQLRDLLKTEERLEAYLLDSLPRKRQWRLQLESIERRQRLIEAEGKAEHYWESGFPSS